MSWRERLVYIAYATCWGLVRLLPERLAYSVFDRIATAVWRRQGPSVRRLEVNLTHVVPDLAADELRRLSLAGLRSYLRYWCDAFRMPGWGPARRDDHVQAVNEHLLHEGLADGKGVVCVLPHSGNWDHAGAWIVGRGVPFTTVAERLKPERLFERFVAYRESVGMEVLPLTGGTETYRTLVARLRAGRMVCLLGDRDLSRGGVEVEFFGAPARLPGGPAALALETGAVLLAVHTYYDGPDLHIVFGPEVTPPDGGSRSERIAAMTQQVAHAFETSIAAHPQDWHMLQRLWSADASRPEQVEPTR
jgi:KDO2-lipid IV(A) lauroyltransferase